MFQNYPNPFNTDTIIKYQLSKGSELSIKVYNLLGQEVITLVERVHRAGYHSIHWDGKDETGVQVNSGIYLLMLKTRDYTAARKMIILR